MSVVNITAGKIKGIHQLNLDGSQGLVENIRKGQVRTSTETLKGSTAAFPSDYAYGEVWELRYSCAFTASQFQGLFMRVAMASGIANTSTLRGAEIDARNAEDQNVGELVGVHATVNVLGTGTITKAYGLHAQVSQRSDKASTITNLAAIWCKLTVEDASTITNGYGILIESEFITGGVVLDAVIRVETTGVANGFDRGIDFRGTKLTTVGSSQVDLISFLDSGGTARALVVNSSGAVASRTL